MKTAIVLFALSSSAFATDFYAKIDDINCKIEKGIVTRKASFGKEFIGSFTETKLVKMDGLEPFIAKAALTATDRPNTDSEFAYSMKHEGKMYTLNVDDSRESQSLIRMISRICR